MITWQKNLQYPLSIGQRDSNWWKKSNWVEAGPSANSSCTWWIKQRWNILDVCLIQHGYLCHRDDKLVTLQPGSSQLFSAKEDFIMKYKFNQSFMNSLHFIVFHYYLKGDVDLATSLLIILILLRYTLNSLYSSALNLGNDLSDLGLANASTISKKHWNTSDSFSSKIQQGQSSCTMRPLSSFFHPPSTATFCFFNENECFTCPKTLINFVLVQTLKQCPSGFTLQESPSFFCTRTQFTWFLYEGIHRIMKARIKELAFRKNH